MWKSTATHTGFDRRNNGLLLDHRRSYSKRLRISSSFQTRNSSLFSGPNATNSRSFWQRLAKRGLTKTNLVNFCPALFISDAQNRVVVKQYFRNVRIRVADDAVVQRCQPVSIFVVSGSTKIQQCLKTNQEPLSETFNAFAPFPDDQNKVMTR